MHLRHTAISLAAAVAPLLCLPPPSHAIVQPLQGRTVDGLAVPADDPRAAFEYDPNLDITWMRDWHTTGTMTWAQAMAWADGLTLRGRTDWRLPSPRRVDGQGLCNVRVCLSEMGYLWFKELLNGTSGNFPQFPPNYGVFQNVQRTAYWLDEPYAPLQGYAWSFFINLTLPGYTTTLFDTYGGYAVAVVDGDVLGPIPEPQTLALMLAGLGLVAARVCRPALRSYVSHERPAAAVECEDDRR